MSYVFTDKQIKVLQLLAERPRTWTELLNGAGLSTRGLKEILKKLRDFIEKENRQDSQFSRVRPIYALKPEKKSEIKAELERNPPLLLADPYQDFRTDLNHALEESKMTMFRMLTHLIDYWWNTHLSTNLAEKILLACVCQAYGDQRTSQQIISYVKRDFAKTTDCIIEAAEKNPDLILTAIVECSRPSRPPFVEKLSRLHTGNYSKYPGRERILQEIKSMVEFPTVAHLRDYAEGFTEVACDEDRKQAESRDAREWKRIESWCSRIRAGRDRFIAQRTG